MTCPCPVSGHHVPERQHSDACALLSAVTALRDHADRCRTMLLAQDVEAASEEMADALAGLWRGDLDALIEGRDMMAGAA